MGREEQLHITVPSLFRCPISLDVMKSPVSLCTGVTYDRSSIQRWLESGHQTCPATNQPLPSTDFVPNLTLHRLIHLWVQSSSARLPGSLAPPPAARSSPSEIRALIEQIVSETARDSCCGALKKVAEFASYREENRRFLAGSDGFVEAIVQVMTRGGGSESEIEVLELAVTVLESILMENGVKERLTRRLLRSDRENCLSPIVSVLRSGRLASKIAAVRILDSIAVDNESKRSIAEMEDVLAESIRLLAAETDESLRDAVLSFLINLTVARSMKNQLVQLGLVPILASFISNQDSTGPTVERSLRLTQMVSTVAEGRQAMSEDAELTSSLVGRLMKLSKAGTEDAVAVLWSMCCVYGDSRAKERVSRSNGMTKVLLVMQSEEDAGVRRMCRDLVKVLRSGGNTVESGLVSYETRTTHIRHC
ncbi:U-box domain-containing protein 29-like [Rhodamnia argentea]|uniref:U-box domain-containing protein n=1 Tax=Rhodamnia argentea TaxID=178133 RepID=A0A8B8P379_9MYRT|nr:U-box domain-containing protein 29-like [Rhodamnia argentea]